ncbi:MAG TPA: histidinol-phosphate transaminase, partial [Firmicutes bacterium]|nr:histidinol-phosphate transaminase [Bacillota bacterium]
PRLLQKGVIIRPAEIFGLPRHFRVTVGTEEENARFLQALREVITEVG